jgi:ABC-type transport system involved in multi-copper enzyme maturation permease subunit
MGPVVWFALMGTYFNFSDAAEQAGQFRGPFGIAPGLEQLAAPDGWIIGIHSSASFIGLIALALFATNIAREYEKGTIRILLVSEPRRLTLMTGKLLALSTFALIICAGAIVLTMGMSLALAPGEGVAIDAWLTGQGALEVLKGFVNIGLATIVWGLIGGVLALLVRSAAISISVGVGFLFIFEILLGQFAPDIGNKLPATVLGALAAGGTFSIEYIMAMIMTIVYGVASLIITLTVFKRRDVTD